MAALHFAGSVGSDGYEWVPADQWNIFDGVRRRFVGAGEPGWRERAPWNSPDTPRLLLRERGCFSDDTRRRPHRVRPAIDDAALYRNFATMDPTPEHIAEFASRFGNLFESQTGVPFGEWEFEIRTMRFLIEIWDATIAKTTSSIKELFPRDRRHSTHLNYPHAETLMKYKRYGEISVRSYPEDAKTTVGLESYACGMKGTLLQVARIFVPQAINCRLRSLGARVELTPSKTSWQLVMSPRDLLGALWFQFAEAVSEQKQFRQCEVCQRYMELSPDVNRADRRFCSDACRNRAQRRRRKLAVDMSASGKSVREISKAIGSDVSTIKQWLEPKGK